MTANHEHTPTMDQIRDDFIEAWSGHFMDGDKGTAEYFDQALRTHNATIEAAAEQRGAVKGLKQLLQELMEGEFQVGHHAGLHTASTIISARLIELLVNADQMEGDDETH